jgi:signal recognition particle receptor subunit beta
LDDVPFILQFNKRDLPETAPVHYMDFLLNNRETRVPSLESVAVDGEGVFEGLNLIARMTLASFVRKHNLRSRSLSDNICVSEEETSQRRSPSCSMA